MPRRYACSTPGLPAALAVLWLSHLLIDGGRVSFHTNHFLILILSLFSAMPCSSHCNTGARAGIGFRREIVVCTPAALGSAIGAVQSRSIWFALVEGSVTATLIAAPLQPFLTSCASALQRPGRAVGETPVGRRRRGNDDSRRGGRPMVVRGDVTRPAPAACCPPAWRATCPNLVAHPSTARVWCACGKQGASLGGGRRVRTWGRPPRCTTHAERGAAGT